jgi:hypothetical protein
MKRFLPGLLVALMAGLVVGGSRSAAAPLGGGQLGFVRGNSIFLAHTDGTHQRVVLRGTKPGTQHNDPLGGFYSDPVWSNNGRLAVTDVVEGGDDSGNSGGSSVLVIRPGRNALRVDIGAWYTGWPTWAPDNQRMAVIDSADVSTLYTLRLGAGQPTSVDLDPDRSYDSSDDEVDPAWSPDGKAIAFVDEAFPAVGLFLIAPDGSKRRQLTQTRAHNPSWSPDSRRIVFDDGYDIDVVNADGSGLRSLISTSARETDPAWSPDGRQIAFVRGGSIWLMNVNGHHARRLIRHGLQPAWKKG